MDRWSKDFDDYTPLSKIVATLENLPNESGYECEGRYGDHYENSRRTGESLHNKKSVHQTSRGYGYEDSPPHGEPPKNPHPRGMDLEVYSSHYEASSTSYRPPTPDRFADAHRTVYLSGDNRPGEALLPLIYSPPLPQRAHTVSSSSRVIELPNNSQADTDFVRRFNDLEEKLSYLYDQIGTVKEGNQDIAEKLSRSQSLHDRFDYLEEK